MIQVHCAKNIDGRLPDIRVVIKHSHSSFLQEALKFPLIIGNIRVYGPFPLGPTVVNLEWVYTT